jgi:hypothetical protein
MLRRLFTVLSALSLALCLATVVLWVRSYTLEDVLEFGDGPPSHSFVSYRGGVTVGWEDSRPETRGARSDTGWGREYEWRRMGFGAGAFRYGRWAHDTSYSSGGYWRWRRFPWWPICVLLSLPPLLHAWRLARRRRRGASGLCPSCGYDLRATPGRCPECGHTPPLKRGLLDLLTLLSLLPCVK